MRKVIFFKVIVNTPSVWEKETKYIFGEKQQKQRLYLGENDNTSPLSYRRSLSLCHTTNARERWAEVMKSTIWDNFGTTKRGSEMVKATILRQLWKRLRSGEACQVAWADSDPQWDAVCVFQPCDDSARKWGQARPMRAQACSTLRSHWSRAVCHQRWSVWESFSRDTGGEAGIRLAGVVTNYFNCFTTAHNCSKLICSCKEQLLRNCAQTFTTAKNFYPITSKCVQLQFTNFHNCKELFKLICSCKKQLLHNCAQLQTNFHKCRELVLTIEQCRDSSAHAAWTSAFNGSV